MNTHSDHEFADAYNAIIREFADELLIEGAAPDIDLRDSDYGLESQIAASDREVIGWLKSLSNTLPEDAVKALKLRVLNRDHAVLNIEQLPMMVQAMSQVMLYRNVSLAARQALVDAVDNKTALSELAANTLVQMSDKAVTLLPAHYSELYSCPAGQRVKKLQDLITAYSLSNKTPWHMVTELRSLLGHAVMLQHTEIVLLLSDTIGRQFSKIAEAKETDPRKILKVLVACVDLTLDDDQWRLFIGSAQMSEQELIEMRCAAAKLLKQAVVLMFSPDCMFAPEQAVKTPTTQPIKEEPTMTDPNKTSGNLYLAVTATAPAAKRVVTTSAEVAARIKAIAQEFASLHFSDVSWLDRFGIDFSMLQATSSNLDTIGGMIGIMIDNLASYNGIGQNVQLLRSVRTAAAAHIEPYLQRWEECHALNAINNPLVRTMALVMRMHRITVDMGQLRMQLRQLPQGSVNDVTLSVMDWFTTDTVTDHTPAWLAAKITQLDDPNERVRHVLRNWVFTLNTPWNAVPMVTAVPATGLTKLNAMRQTYTSLLFNHTHFQAENVFDMIVDAALLGYVDDDLQPTYAAMKANGIDVTKEARQLLYRAVYQYSVTSPYPDPADSKTPPASLFNRNGPTQTDTQIPLSKSNPRTEGAACTQLPIVHTHVLYQGMIYQVTDRRVVLGVSVAQILLNGQWVDEALTQPLMSGSYSLDGRFKWVNGQWTPVSMVQPQPGDRWTMTNLNMPGMHPAQMTFNTLNQNLLPRSGFIAYDDSMHDDIREAMSAHSRATILRQYAAGVLMPHLDPTRQAEVTLREQADAYGRALGSALHKTLSSSAMAMFTDSVDYATLEEIKKMVHDRFMLAWHDKHDMLYMGDRWTKADPSKPMLDDEPTESTAAQEEPDDDDGSIQSMDHLHASIAQVFQKLQELGQVINPPQTPVWPAASRQRLAYWSDVASVGSQMDTLTATTQACMKEISDSLQAVMQGMQTEYSASSQYRCQQGGQRHTTLAWQATLKDQLDSINTKLDKVLCQQEEQPAAQQPQAQPTAESSNAELRHESRFDLSQPCVDKPTAVKQMHSLVSAMVADGAAQIKICSYELTNEQEATQSPMPTDTASEEPSKPDETAACAQKLLNALGPLES